MLSLLSIYRRSFRRRMILNSRGTYQCIVHPAVLSSIMDRQANARPAPGHCRGGRLPVCRGTRLPNAQALPRHSCLFSSRALAGSSLRRRGALAAAEGVSLRGRCCCQHAMLPHEDKRVGGTPAAHGTYTAWPTTPRAPRRRAFPRWCWHRSRMRRRRASHHFRCRQASPRLVMSMQSMHRRSP